MLGAVQGPHQSLEDLLLGHGALGTTADFAGKVLVLTLEEFDGIDEFFLFPGSHDCATFSDGTCCTDSLCCCARLLLQSLHLDLMLLSEGL